MKKKLIIIYVTYIMTATTVFGETINWEPAPDDVEFGITSVIDGSIVQNPWVIESGYGGAWVISNLYWGMGQSFTVESKRTLNSVQLRIGRQSIYNLPTGQFEVAVYEFDIVNNIAQSKIAYALADAEDYSGYGYNNTPISSFDMSGFNAVLDPSQTYALAVTQMPSFNGAMIIHASKNYPYGSAYYLSIPEPATLLLLGIGAMALRKKKAKGK